MSAVPSGLADWLALNERRSIPRRETWHHAGDVLSQLVADIANKAKDKADTELDAKRVHDGMTLDEYMDSQR